METNQTLSEYIWEYASKHDFVSRTIIAGKYISVFEVRSQSEGRDERKKLQKSLERKIASMFTIMRNLKICSKHSQTAVHINREVFNAFTLDDVLKCKLSDFHKKPTKPETSILSKIAQIK